MRSLVLPLIVMAVGCASDGSGEPDLDDYDARCVTACTDEPPRLEGAGDVCNSSSRTQCLDTCQARIMDVSAICASCLTEEVCFNPGGCDDFPVPGDECNNNTCTRTGRNGSCTYPANDSAARDNCERQVNPRREVACTAEFPSVQSCASVCQM